MAEHVTPLKTITNQASGALDSIKDEATELIDAIDLEPISRKVRELGRERPVSLALAALAVGMAAAMAMRRRIKAP